MILHTLKPNKGAKHRIKRLGKGESSGLGKTSGKGHWSSKGLWTRMMPSAQKTPVRML